jgi:hypothetical protein
MAICHPTLVHNDGVVRADREKGARHKSPHVNLASPCNVSFNTMAAEAPVSEHVRKRVLRVLVISLLLDLVRPPLLTVLDVSNN